MWEFFGFILLINTLNSHIFKFNYLKTNKIKKHITTTNKKTKITRNCLIIQKNEPNPKNELWDSSILFKTRFLIPMNNKKIQQVLTWNF